MPLARNNHRTKKLRIPRFFVVIGIVPTPFPISWHNNNGYLWSSFFTFPIWLKFQEGLWQKSFHPSQISWLGLWSVKILQKCYCLIFFYANCIQMCLFQFHIAHDWYFGTGGQQLFVKHQCKVSNCFITNNRYYIFLYTLINLILLWLKI